MDSLDSRKKFLLKAVVLEYVRDGEPVGSEYLVQKYEFGVRSATIRNELADLSELGLLEKPHTSSGRIPSESGYRYYVENIVEDVAPDDSAKERISAAAAKDELVQALLHETTRTLSRLSHQLAAATTVRNSSRQARNAIVTALGPNAALLVLALDNGEVLHKTFEIPSETAMSELGQLNAVLATEVANKNLAELSKLALDNTPRTGFDRLRNSVVGAIRSAAKDASTSPVITHGEEYMVAQPEYRQDPALLSQVMRGLEDEDGLSQVVANATPSPRHVTIGSDHLNPDLGSVSVLRQTFFVGEEQAGTLALIGPTRIDYQTNLALLAYAAEALGQTLHRLTR